MKDKSRYKMTVLAFVFFSIAGGGFVLKGIVNQFTKWGNNSFILYAIATLIYAIPYIFMMLEFMSLKSLRKAESGYQTWLNAIIGKKYGFFGAFFYFFVNLFYFIDLIPGIISYFLYTILPQESAKHTLDQVWLKPVIAVCGVILFWIATFISAKGPKWMTKISSFAGFSGFIMTVVFMIGAIVSVGIGPAKLVVDNTAYQADFNVVSKFDISWGKIAAISWALQSLGGMEALAAYKNNIKGGQKSFKKAIWINMWIFTAIILAVALLAQAVIPTHLASSDKYGIVGTIYLAFEVIHFPAWWGRIVALLMLITTFGGSLMLWTAAPVKILFADAPKGIFGKKLSKTDKEGTPVNALITQAIIVTVLIIVFSLGQMSSGINKFLEAIRNIDGGAAGIPVLFIAFAYLKMRLGKNNPKYERDYYFLGKNPVWSIIAITPMFLLFAIANVTALIPSPEDWRTDIGGSLIHIFVGLGGIIGAWLYCEWRWRKWRKNNPEDNSLFNEVGDQEDFSLKKLKDKISNKKEKEETLQVKENG